MYAALRPWDQETVCLGSEEACQSQSQDRGEDNCSRNLEGKGVAGESFIPQALPHVGLHLGTAQDTPCPVEFRLVRKMDHKASLMGKRRNRRRVEQDQRIGLSQGRGSEWARLPREARPQSQ